MALARTSMAVCTRGASAWAASWAAAAAMRAASTRRLEWVMVAEVWTRGHGGDWRGTGVRNTPTLSTKTPGDGAPDMEPVFQLFFYLHLASLGISTILRDRPLYLLKASFSLKVPEFQGPLLTRHQNLPMELLSTNCLNMQKSECLKGSRSIGFQE